MQTSNDVIEFKIRAGSTFSLIAIKLKTDGQRALNFLKMIILIRSGWRLLPNEVYISFELL